MLFRAFYTLVTDNYQCGYLSTFIVLKEKSHIGLQKKMHLTCSNTQNQRFVLITLCVDALNSMQYLI